MHFESREGKGVLDQPLGLSGASLEWGYTVRFMSLRAMIPVLFHAAARCADVALFPPTFVSKCDGIPAFSRLSCDGRRYTTLGTADLKEKVSHDTRELLEDSPTCSNDVPISWRHYCEQSNECTYYHCYLHIRVPHVREFTSRKGGACVLGGLSLPQCQQRPHGDQNSETAGYTVEDLRLIVMKMGHECPGCIV